MVFSTRLMLETKLHHLFVLIFLFPCPKYYNYFSKRIKNYLKHQKKKKIKQKWFSAHSLSREGAVCLFHIRYS